MRHLLMFFALALVVGTSAAKPPRETQSSVPDAAGTVAARPPSAAITEPTGANAGEPSASETAKADASAHSEQPLAGVLSVKAEDVDNQIICERKTRPGSRITYKSCYSQQQHLAEEGAREKALRGQLDELQREQRWRDEIVRQAEAEGRRPSGFGLGPD